MKTVRQLDQDDPDILGHGQEHLPQVLCLHFHLVRGIGQLAELGHAVHQKRHLTRRIPLSISSQVIHGIFHRIMEQSGDDGLFIQFQICQDNCYA